MKANGVLGAFLEAPFQGQDVIGASAGHISFVSKFTTYGGQELRQDTTFGLYTMGYGVTGFQEVEFDLSFNPVTDGEDLGQLLTIEELETMLRCDCFLPEGKYDELFDEKYDLLEKHELVSRASPFPKTIDIDRILQEGSELEKRDIIRTQEIQNILNRSHSHSELIDIQEKVNRLREYYYGPITDERIRTAYSHYLIDGVHLGHNIHGPDE